MDDVRPESIQELSRRAIRDSKRAAVIGIVSVLVSLVALAASYLR